VVLTIEAVVTSTIGAEAITGEVFLHEVVTIRDTIRDILNLMEGTINRMDPFPHPHQIFPNPTVIFPTITQIAQSVRSAINPAIPPLIATIE
jgi:tetrahydromethanopterin S-methyltransferase subunit B